MIKIQQFEPTLPNVWYQRKDKQFTPYKDSGLRIQINSQNPGIAPSHTTMKEGYPIYFNDTQTVAHPSIYQEYLISTSERTSATLLTPDLYHLCAMSLAEMFPKLTKKESGDRGLKVYDVIRPDKTLIYRSTSTAKSPTPYHPPYPYLAGKISNLPTKLNFDEVSQAVKLKLNDLSNIYKLHGTFHDADTIYNLTHETSSYRLFEITPDLRFTNYDTNISIFGLVQHPDSYNQKEGKYPQLFHALTNFVQQKLSGKQIKRYIKSKPDKHVRYSLSGEEQNDISQTNLTKLNIVFATVAFSNIN